MPGIAHLITGTLFALLLYNTNPKRFTRKHALIFALMAYLGPDFASTQTFGYQPLYRLGHSILGWPIYAIWMVPIYTFLTRFTFDLKTLQLYDQGPNSQMKLPWWRVYLLMIAGGLFHFSVDITFENKRVWPYPLNDPFKITVEQLKENLSYTRYESDIFLFISIGLLLIMFLLFNEFMKQADQTGKKTKLNVTITTFVSIFIIYFAIVGSTGEPDLGAITYFTIFFFGPFILALFTFNPPNYTPKKNSYDDNKGELKLKIASGYFVILGSIMLIVAIILSITIDPIVGMFLDEDVVREIVSQNLIIILVGVYAIAIFLFGIAYLLYTRKNVGQRLASFILVCPGIIILISLVIWGLLREKEVVKLFENKKSS